MGYGDEIMASGEARQLKRARPNARVVIGDGTCEIWSEASSLIFRGNSNIARLHEVPVGVPIVWLENYQGRRPYIDYVRTDMNHRQFFLPYRPVAGDLFLSEDERERADVVLSEPRGRRRPLVFIEPHVEFGPNKDWGMARWQAVVDALAGRATFVQPSYGKPILNHVSPAPSASFREACALLDRCDLYVGPEGGLHHAAAALRRPAVVVFGGRVHPDVTGYAFHVNLYVDRPESPCGMVAPCAHCRACLESIGEEQVIAHVAARLDVSRRR